MTLTPAQRDRARGVLLATAAGDALGADAAVLARPGTALHVETDELRRSVRLIPVLLSPVTTPANASVARRPSVSSS